MLRALDLFCCAGGATKGLQRAGFHVTGVDIKPQPRYCGDAFIQADAMTFKFSPVSEFVGGSMDGRPEWCDRCGLKWELHFDFVWASPPCQAHTDLRSMYNAKKHEDLIPWTRQRLSDSGIPYVIENVEGSPLVHPAMLCGSMFGLQTENAELRRHRLFESSFQMITPSCAHGKYERVIGVYGGHGRDRRRVVNTQNFSTEQRREAMGIDWMTGVELSQAIPPAYSEFIGKQAIAWLESKPVETYV